MPDGHHTLYTRYLTRKELPNLVVGDVYTFEIFDFFLPIVTSNNVTIIKHTVTRG